MESNKEDSQKCFDIARTAIHEKNFEKSLKFLKKSIKLFPTEEAKNLLHQLQTDTIPKWEQSKAEDNSDKKRNPNFPDLSELHGSAKPEKPAYTQEQKDLANRINRCKDYYEILGVSKTASDLDLKKAYKKMALQLHPDKNSAPGSTEAFKAVGKSFAVLSDSNKRKDYDQYGPDGLRSTANVRRDGDFEDPFNADEIFNMFFGGGFPSENVRVFRHGNAYYFNRNARQQPPEEEQHWLTSLIRLMPLIIIVMSSWTGFFFSSEPLYTMVSQNEYNEMKVTGNFKVEYYVKHGFDQQFPEGSPSRRRVEDQVEDEYVSHLRKYCYNERVEKETVRRKGIYFKNSDLLQQYEKMTTPSCDELDTLFN